MDVNFRRIDVDKYDPEKFMSLAELTPPAPAVSISDMQARAQQVKALLSKGDYTAALSAGLDDAPYGGDEATKVSLTTFSALFLN